MGIFRVLSDNYRYRKEDKRRVAMGLPTQQESENAQMRAMMISMGLVPKEGLEGIVGWDTKRDGARVYEHRISQLRARLDELERIGAPVEERLELELEIRQIEKKLAGLHNQE